MKNLIVHYQNEKEELFINHRRYNKLKQNKGWSRKYYFGPNIEGLSIWKLIKNIGENSIGKNVDEVKKKIKTKLKYTKKEYSLDYYFDRIFPREKRFGYNKAIVKNNIFCINEKWLKWKKENNIKTIFSKDYSIKYVLKNNPEIFLQKSYYHWYYYKKGKAIPTYVCEEDVKIITTGTSTQYHKNSHTWKKHIAEKKTILRKEKKARKKALREKQYSFLMQSEIKIKEEKKNDLVKLIKHGFDPITSFRTDKQTNPDLIRGL